MAINNPGGGSFTDFVQQIMKALPYNDPMDVKLAEDAGKANHLRPVDMKRNKEIDSDPTNIYSDDGQIVGQQDPNSLLGLLTNGARPGSLGYFIGKTLNAFASPQTAGVEATDPRAGSGAVTRGNDLNPVPSANQRQPNLAPDPAPKDYSPPSTIPPEALTQLRDDVQRKLGVQDTTVFEPVDPNSLAGRMSGPYSKLDQKSQMQEAQDISQQFRGAGVSGPVVRARPQPQGFDPQVNRAAKGDVQQQPKRKTPLITGD